MANPRKKQTTKHITKKMAQKTADDIQAYWLKKGLSVELWVIRVTNGNESDYGVRSNMQNGKPLT